MTGARYYSYLVWADRRGNKYSVRPSLGSEYKAFRQDHNHSGETGWHAVRSPALPWRADPADAEEDLRKWAEQKGLRLLDEGR